MSNVTRFYRRCAWSKPCDEHATERRQMLWYCWDHADVVDVNREAMFVPLAVDVPTAIMRELIEEW